jgi:hypothetical protein
MSQGKFWASVNEERRDIDIQGGCSVDWSPVDSETVLVLGLSHVRAADNIEIQYDFTRDGWVIFRTVTVGWTEPTAEKHYIEGIEKRKELAFIPSWDEEQADEPA